MSEGSILSQFPKIRSSLTPEFERIYAEHYRSNREGESPASSLAQKMENWLHRQVARDITDEPQSGKSTLEVGAGTLNQLRHEPVVGPYDIVEPFKALFAGSPLLERVRHVYADIAEISHDQRYDRITAIAVFEHICELPEVVARCGLLMAPGGSLRSSIPNEGTLLWGLGWKLTTGVEFRLKHRLDYGELMRHEHVNKADEIEKVLEHFFESVECRVFGLSRSLAFYRYHECRSPRLDRCREYLERGAI